MWRVLTHDTLSVSLDEIETQWCIDQLCRAHTMLDAIDAARAAKET